MFSGDEKIEKRALSVCHMHIACWMGYSPIQLNQLLKLWSPPELLIAQLLLNMTCSFVPLSSLSRAITSQSLIGRWCLILHLISSTSSWWTWELPTMVQTSWLGLFRLSPSTELDAIKGPVQPWIYIHAHTFTCIITIYFFSNNLLNRRGGFNPLF